MGSAGSWLCRGTRRGELCASCSRTISNAGRKTLGNTFHLVFSKLCSQTYRFCEIHFKDLCNEGYDWGSNQTPVAAARIEPLLKKAGS